MKKKYQIFISSTYEDLKEERKKVQDTILSMCHFPIGMEMFSAADEEQWEIIQETIDSSDYYVLIIGHRYGSLIEDGEFKGISYTQKEFRYALEKQIPILVFVIDSNVPVNVKNIEQDSKKKRKLEEFIKEATTGRMVEWWTSKDDLANKVSIALSKQISRGKRPGWIRSDTVNIEDTQKELVEMSKKIRMLEEENERLKKNIVNRNPELTLSINNDTNIEIPYIEYDSKFIEYKYMALSINDIPNEAKKYITKEMIDKYNATLPSKDEIEKLKNEWRFCQQAQQDKTNIDITIYNDGNMKAKDIYIEIQFPDEIVLYEKASELPTPNWLPKGENPLEEYYNKIKKDQYNIDKITPKYSSIFNNILSQYPINTINSRDKCFYNDGDNSLSIRMEDLMTGYTWNISDEYFVVPKERGEFQIVCSFMCEEYDKQIEQIIKVVVK